MPKNTKAKVATKEISSLQPAINEAERIAQWLYDNLAPKAKAKATNALPLTITIQREAKEAKCVWRREGMARWSDLKGKLSNEINIPPHILHDGEVAIVTWINHGVKHSYAADHDIKDCSASGYHNGTGKGLGEAFGCIVTKSSDTRGWDTDEFTPETWARIQDELKPDMTAFTLAKAHLPKEEPKKRQTTVKWHCGVCEGKQTACYVSSGIQFEGYHCGVLKVRWDDDAALILQAAA
tara:strand:+ start:32 stop:745 length:714 start_codon:yes stop_codon:yes gene_type:complete